MRWSEARLRDVLEAMFRSDGRGRTTGDAPALYVVRSRDAVVCGCRADLPDEVVAALEEVAERPRGRFPEWERQYGDYIAALAAIAPIASVRGGPLWAFPDEIHDFGPTVRVGPADAHLLLGGLDEWVADAAAGMPMTASLEDGRAAGVCASVRVSAKVHCAGVETASDRRERGHASRATAGWGRLVRELGAEPLYGTTFDNLGSQGVARRLGLVLIGSEFSVDIGPAAAAG